MSADGDSFSSACRLIEALIFAMPRPVSEREIARHLPEDIGLAEVMGALLEFYDARGVALIRVRGGWRFSCAETLKELEGKVVERVRTLSRPTMALLVEVALRQPVSAAELEERRGRRVESGLKRLAEDGWIIQGANMLQGSRPAVTWVTTQAFLDRLGLSSIEDFPTEEEIQMLLRADDSQDTENQEEVGFLQPFRLVSA